ncbi:putative guanine nucleotide exchange factor for Ras-like GTPases; N-terminal motif containing protein [Lyophyllum shimeji]|uniref:Guanine nucleotide exchange factor for Ras-like GTPases N-terminal motif containing protein n=1 Tax=Lyophyllum shimeji TaxID=47721 RepID=A0A9P3PMI6_LYOSH|nr:putative guanine nucleotide exchange factor for Ras-like GTPases; N-terminal motif containing protein [Lyophyllum shimeji]
MYPNQLKINTKLGPNLGIAGPSKLPARTSRSRSPLRGPRQANSLGVAQRMRSASTASSSSSLSIVSPATPSTNGSTSSLAIPRNHDSHTRAAPSRSPSPSSPVIEDTARIGSEYVLAMHDYAPQHQNATCLTFRAGQVIHVLNKDASGWWDGELEGRRGWFPSNYVNADFDSLTEEQLPNQSIRGHSHSASVASTVSWASSTSIETPQRHRRAPIPEEQGQDIDSYCPALMVPLLNSLSLLQSAVRANRTSHFPPSTACIISCVRSILSTTQTLVRDAPILQQHPPLAQERRRILSVLAALVTQAKKAAEGTSNDQNQEVEVETMLRLGGQVFASVRRFLAVAVQCGVALPNPRNSTGSTDTEGPSWGDPDVSFDTPAISYGIDSPNGRTPTQARLREREFMATAGSALRVKSMGDLRSQVMAATEEDSDATPLLPNRPSARKLKEHIYLQDRFVPQHRPGLPSVSSISSSSSFSSQDSSPPAPPFPSGPSTTAQVMEALRLTHDQYLSTIAAFIGHAHSHSRTSHASSTGHLYDLVREIVEMVCKLLTIVEAVMQHPGIPANRLGNLKSAKEGLYNVTSSLAESVRLLTVSLPPTLTDEEEKQTLLRSATSALKAGADCVAAVKVCLNRSVGESPFIINMPAVGDETVQPFTPSKFSNSPLAKSASMSALQGFPTNGADDEDLTIQAVSPSPVRRPREISSGSEDSGVSKASSLQSIDTAATTPDYTKHRPPSFTNINHAPVEADLPSPRSMARTEDDRTTWEGSVRGHDMRVDNGDLPTAPLDAMPDVIQDPSVWMLSHDYSLEDVAYNSEGVLVGATMEVLVEKMTPHDSLVDPAFSAVFFLTFRLFSSPVELVDAIIARYNIQPPQGISEEDIQLWQQRKGVPVRLRVSNFIKIWVEMYWRPGVDDPALPALTLFTRKELAHFFPGPAQRILELITLRRQTTDFTISPKGDRSRDPGMSINPPSTILLTSEVPRPTMTKTLLVALRKKEFASIVVTDFDALELARQLTIMECNLYCAIQPEEVLETGSEGAKPPVNVRAVSSLSTVITGWVAESILSELDLKKRTALVRFYIKVADRCSSLHNYSTSRSILAALDSSTISRLHQTWLGVPQKYKGQLESLRRLADHSRNYHEYRTKLRNTAPPAVPFLGLYLTDVTFCREGNPSHRASPINASKKLLNFNKYHKLARIVQDMQRFQVPYNLKAIPEVQEYLNVAFENSRHHGDLQDLYRRSLLVEPRQPADAAPAAGDMRQLFNWATRSQPQTATAPS